MADYHRNHTRAAKRLITQAERAEDTAGPALLAIAHALVAISERMPAPPATPTPEETPYDTADSTDADDPVLEAIFQQMRHHPARAGSRTDWLYEPPFKDDPEARARLRVETARRVAFNLGKLQAIDEYDQHTGTTPAS